MSITKVRITRDDFRKAAKICKLKGHSTCHCVVAKAILRTRPTINAPTLSVGYTGYSAKDLTGKNLSQSCLHGKQRQVVNLFDDAYQRKPADTLYKLAREKNVLELEFIDDHNY